MRIKAQMAQICCVSLDGSDMLRFASTSVSLVPIKKLNNCELHTEIAAFLAMTV